MQVAHIFLGPVKAPRVSSAVDSREGINLVARYGRSLRCSPLVRGKQYSHDRAGLAISSAIAAHESAASPSSADAGGGTWDAFAASVSGEWEGITATFDAQ